MYRWKFDKAERNNDIKRLDKGVRLRRMQLEVPR